MIRPSESDDLSMALSESQDIQVLEFNQSTVKWTLLDRSTNSHIQNIGIM